LPKSYLELLSLRALRCPTLKNFLIITQVFTPDPAAVGQYFDEAAQAIAESGAQVTVLTANRGYDDPNARFPAKEDRDGIRIRRLPLSSLGKANIAIRLVAQLSFLAQCILRGLFTPKLTDLLVSTSPPMAAITAVVIGFCRPSLKVHYWVMDLNPDQSVELGAFGPRHPLVQALDWLNRRILHRANTVIALDRFMAERLRVKIPPSQAAQFDFSKIKILPPWPMDQHIEPVAHADNPFRKQQGWADKFVVMYSGNHSLVHPLDTLLDAAEQLKDDPQFVFVFIGGGKGKQAVEARIQKNTRDTSEAPQSPESKTAPTTALCALPYQPLETIRYSLSAADLHIVSLGNNMSGIVHPCKIYGALCIGRPVLTLGPKESYLGDIVDAQDIGWSIEHGDVAGAVTALKAAAEQTQTERTAIGQRARRVATEQFSREHLLKKFLNTVLGD
jgi:glycosyltransferase involved in cell wall biosynthesis